MAMGDSVMRSICRFAKEEGGAVAIQIALTTTVLLGFAGLVFDLGEAFTLNTELQQAADAAALAAAAELDGATGAQTRATNAACGAATCSTTLGDFGTNAETFASSGAGAIAIKSIVFLSAIGTGEPKLLPPNPSLQTGDVTTTSDLDAAYVRVQVQTNSITGTLASFVTKNSTFTTTAVATAGRVPIVCLDVPLLICNPADPDPPPNLAPGKEIRVKSSPGGGVGTGSLAPGNWGLLCPPNTNCGAQAIDNFLATASSSVTSQCTNNFLTGTGNKTPVSNGFNTRFDIYAKNSDSKNKDYPPASNVTKGFSCTISGPGNGSTCGSTLTGAMGPPLDQNFDSNGVGDGNWDRTGYWNANHASTTLPTITSAGLSATATRYQVYNWENTTPDAVVSGRTTSVPDSNTKTGTTTEDALRTGSKSDPQANYSGSGTPTPLRRVLNFAIVNCSGLTGKTNVTPVGYFQGFLTNPVTDTDQTIYMEVIQQYSFSNAGGPIHNHVQLVR